MPRPTYFAVCQIHWHNRRGSRDYIIVTKNSQDPGIQSAGEAIIIIETAV